MPFERHNLSSLLITVVILLSINSLACTLTPQANPSDVAEVHNYLLITEVPIYDNPLPNTGIHSLDWNPNGNTIAIGVWLEAFLYEVDSGNLERIKETTVTSPLVSWSLDGNLLGAGDGTLSVWDFKQNEMLVEIPPSGSLNHYGRIYWNANSHLIVTTLFSDLDNAQIQTLDVLNGTVTDYNVVSLRNSEALGWTSDGKYLAVVELGRPDIHVVDYATQQVVYSYKANVASDFPFGWMPQANRFVVQDSGGSLVVWDTLNRISISTLPNLNEVFDLAWHPQNTHVALAGEDGVSIWNVESGVVFVVQNEEAFAVDWSPDGQQLVTHVGTIMRIYDITELP